MERTNKLNAKRNSALAYKFSELQTVNKLKKLLSLIDFADATGELAFCYQTYSNDEAILRAV